MTKLILISHGKLSAGMAYSAQMIAGETPNICSYGLMPGGDVEIDVIGPVREALHTEPDTQLLIVSDLYCGSIYNGSFSLQKEPNALIATGMNLSLVVNLLMELDNGFTAESFEQAVAESREYTMVLPALQMEDDESTEDFF